LNKIDSGFYKMVKNEYKYELITKEPVVRRISSKMLF
jgi:hypothetical protein